MTGWLTLSASFLAGALLGTAFFWGLWMTVRDIEPGRPAAVRMAASMLVRFGAAAVGFFLLARYAGWQALLAAAAGFTLPRLLIVRRLTARGDRRTPQTGADD